VRQVAADESADRSAHSKELIGAREKMIERDEEARGHF
jgi:hypothetical protein